MTTRKELIKIIKDIAEELGVENSEDWAPSFAARLDEEFLLVEDENVVDHDEEEDE